MSAMPPWRETALRLLPELAEPIGEAENPYQLWFGLWDAFRAAYGPPRDDGLIRRVYEYAQWCEQAPRGETATDDLFTTVVVCFFEEIPTDAQARADMPRWFTYEEVRDAREVFSYMAGAAVYEELLRHMAASRGRYQPWRGKRKGGIGAEER